MYCGPPPTSVREGKQEGLHLWAIQENNISPSVTNRFISDGVKYSSQIHLLLYHLCVLAYCCPSLHQFPEAHAVAFCLILLSSHQPALSSHLANYAFKPNRMLKEIVALYTLKQLMKMEDDQATKFTCKKFQNKSTEQQTWKLNERKSTHCIWRKYWRAKSKMQSANNQSAHSYSNGAAAVFGGWVWPADSSCLLSCRGFVTSTKPFALSDYAIRLVIVQHRGQNVKP